ncbi:hypothetical protein JHD49_07720 [Sulfurimonas sp. SAG-AH-194-C21]|nr:hypothetical protein [Sulfurimonas sp. SAG-AH-194-C21]MDF1883819.1 hypothetical protein [Sulfurimonas sp. SAG-AH-194-C21]
MKRRSFGISLTILTALSVGFSGCGSSSSDGSTTQTNSGGGSSAPIVKIGIFVDAPVYGLKYVTPTQTGYTNSSGEFKYEDGEKVEFFLNTLSLGKVTASTLITPYTMAGDTDLANPSAKASNIALLLQNFDANRSNGAILDVSKFKDLGVYNLSSIDLTSTTDAMEVEIVKLLATGGFQEYIDASDLKLVNTSTANSTMKKYFKDDLVSYETGFGSKWLNGKTLYNVQQQSPNGNLGPITAATMSFNNGKVKLAQGITTKYILTVDYNITSEGFITFDTGGQQWIKFNSQNSDFIETCFTNDKARAIACTATSRTREVFFFDETKAKAALANPNFFDYMLP